MRSFPLLQVIHDVLHTKGTQMITTRIEQSTDISEARQRFLQELRTWIYRCLEMYGNVEPADGHDQLTYTTGWAPYLEHVADDQVISFLKSSRDKAAKHFRANGMWKHGYWKQQEAHHGTEHYDLFLRFLFEIDPDDEDTRRQLIDAIEHMANLIPEIPDWFNQSTGLFHSFWFGTDHVGKDGDDGANVPEHLRCVNLCLLAYRISQDGRYRSLAQEYAGRWAEAICATDILPIALASSGPVYSLQGEAESVRNPLRAENLLASNGIGAFLDLWKLTGEGTFLNAAERLLDILSDGLIDPDAGVAADAIRHYRRITGKTRYDSKVLDVCQRLSPENITQIGIEPHVDRPGPAVRIGIGKRGDMPDWFEDGARRRHNPILLSVAAEISGDASLGAIALDIGRAYFVLGRKAFSDGRKHGCSSRSVSAVARGHGRDNHAGVTTAVLGPITRAFCQQSS